MRSRTRAGDGARGSRILRPGLDLIAAVVRGRFLAACERGLEVHDPEAFWAQLPDRARSFVVVDALRVGRLHPHRWEHGIVRVIGPDLRRALERLLTGGGLRWAEDCRNIVVNEGLDHLLDVTLSAAAQDTTWFAAPMNATPTPAAGDTMASHAGWTEFTTYSEAARQAWTDGGVSSQSVDNSGSPAAYSINGTATAGGAFLAGDGTKSGATGTLYAGFAFTGGNQAVSSGDTLQITYTASMADDGA